MDISNADTPRVDKRLTSLKWFAVFVGTTKELHLPALSDIVLTWGKNGCSYHRGKWGSPVDVTDLIWPFYVARIKRLSAANPRFARGESRISFDRLNSLDRL